MPCHGPASAVWQSSAQKLLLDSHASSHASVRMATAYTAPTTGLALGQSGAPQQEPCQTSHQTCVQSTPLATSRKPPHRGHIIKIAHGHPPPPCPPRSRQSKQPLQQLLPLRAVPHCSSPTQPIQLGHCACSTVVTHHQHKSLGPCLVSPAAVRMQSCCPAYTRRSCSCQPPDTTANHLLYDELKVT